MYNVCEGWQVGEETGGFVVMGVVMDLHIHTKRLSPCSEMSPEEAAIEAKKIGLDGICFTEHNQV